MLADEIAAHVHGYRAGGFMRDLFEWATDTWPPAPTSPRARFVVEAIDRHLRLTFHRVAPLPDFGEGDELVLNQVEFMPGAALPFKLSWSTQTRQSAASALGSDTAEGGNGLAVSFFQPDGRVVALHFLAGGVGLERVHVVRVGPEVDLSGR